MTVTLFENARVFDGMSAERSDPVCVVVESNRIRDISTTPPDVRGATTVDCRGRTLMPGLIDAHIHVYTESTRLTLPEPPITYRAHYAQLFLRHILSCGVTTVRDVAGGDHGLAMALRARLFEGPRFFYGGLCLTQTGGHGDIRSPNDPTLIGDCGAQHNVIAIHADGVDECIKATREELRKGASHIKIMASGGVLSVCDPLERSQYSEVEIRAIVEECERRGAYVCAHCHPAESIQRCVQYGVRSIEHGTLIDDATARFVAERGAFVVPTTAAIASLFENAERLGLPESSQEKLRRVHENAVEGLSIMKRAGVKMGFGTDLVGELHPCRDLELEIRRRALSPFDILHSATAVNAELLQMKGSLGVIKAGALADLLVVCGNPLKDLTCLMNGGRSISHIMRDGQFVKASSMCTA